MIKVPMQVGEIAFIKVSYVLCIGRCEGGSSQVGDGSLCGVVDVGGSLPLSLSLSHEWKMIPGAV